jgi:KaiC/GvpD/RAD55 family RecA-like ATPase
MYEDFDEDAEALTRYPFLADLKESPAHKEAHVPEPRSDQSFSVATGRGKKAEQIGPKPLEWLDWRNCFSTKAAWLWLRPCKDVPPRRKLFSDFWLEGEISILFADTGLGKSALAVQIADSITRGRPIAGFEMEAEKQRVIYFDFEQSGRQFRARYSALNPHTNDFEDPYLFSPDLLRTEIFPEYSESRFGHSRAIEYFLDSFCERVTETGSRIVIVDNITYLYNTLQDSLGALRIMKYLKSVKRKLDISILVLAHTPKRHFRAPITASDLQGSRMFANFADNIFAIGSSARGSDVRYIKHIKPRNTSIRFDASNVGLFRLQKRRNFLAFEFIGFGDERDHLKCDVDAGREKLIQRACELAKLGRSQRDIAAELGIAKTTVQRYLETGPPGPPGPVGPPGPCGPALNRTGTDDPIV